MDKPFEGQEGGAQPTGAPVSLAPLRPALPGEANVATMLKCQLCGKLYLKRGRHLRVEKRGAPDTAEFCSRDHAMVYWRLYHPRSYDPLAGAAAVIEWRAYRAAHADEFAAKRAQLSENLKKAYAKRLRRKAHDNRYRPGRVHKKPSAAKTREYHLRRQAKLKAMAACRLCTAAGTPCRAHR